MEDFFQDFFPSMALGLLTFLVLKPTLTYARRLRGKMFMSPYYDWALVAISAFAASLPTTFLK